MLLLVKIVEISPCYYGTLISQHNHHAKYPVMMEIPDRLVLGPGIVQSNSDDVTSWETEDSIPDRSKRIASSPKVPVRLWVSPSLFSSGCDRGFKLVRIVKLITHLHLVYNIKMLRAIPLFPTGIYCAMFSSAGGQRHQ